MPSTEYVQSCTMQRVDNCVLIVVGRRKWLAVDQQPVLKRSVKQEQSETAYVRQGEYRLDLEYVSWYDTSDGQTDGQPTTARPCVCIRIRTVKTIGVIE